jgi:atypical dual specificity phosphatase
MRRRRRHEDEEKEASSVASIPNTLPSSLPLSLPPLQHHSFIPPTLILPFLYLGSAQALHEDSLTKLGITHVLSLCLTPHFHATTHQTHKHLLLRDSSSQALRPYVEDVCAFVDAAQELGGACLVHCSAGASRSPTMVLAYFVLRRRCALRDAYEHVKALRPQIAPNQGFWLQLLEMEREVLGSNSLSVEELDSKKAD